MTGDCHVRFLESVGVKLRCATRLHLCILHALKFYDIHLKPNIFSKLRY